MDSAIPPSSSEPPERDREVLEVVEGTEIVKESLDVGLKKGDSSWVAVAKDKRVLKKYEVKVKSKDGKNKLEILDEIFSNSTPL